MADPDVVVRAGGPVDVEAICGFGAQVIPDHYAPLIGDEAAAAQVRDWWSVERIGAAVAAGLVVVAERAGTIVGVGQRGTDGRAPVIYKLYLAPEARGHGLGRRLIDALVAQLPPDADRIRVEHFAANERAGAFYEREGFVVERIEPGPTEALGVVWRVRGLVRHG